MKFDFTHDDLQVTEWTPPTKSNNPANKIGIGEYDDETKYTITPDFIIRLSDKSRFCNLPDREHRDKWYSKHDSDGDFYWCPDCDDLQAG